MEILDIPQSILSLNLFTPIAFELTEIIESNKPQEEENRENHLKMVEERKKREEIELGKYSNTKLPSSCTIGLKNLGNNCYINSVLQCLLNNPSFYYNLEEILENHDFKEKTLRFSFLDFFKKLMSICFNNQKLKQISPLSLIKNIEIVSPKFERNKQSDAMSFLRAILETICSEISMNNYKNSKIWKLFEGEQRRIIKCPKCGYELKKDDKFTNIGVLQGFYGNLKKARAGDLKKIEIKGYECDRCELEVNAEQTIIVKKRKKIIFFLLNI